MLQKYDIRTYWVKYLKCYISKLLPRQNLDHHIIISSIYGLITRHVDMRIHFSADWAVSRHKNVHTQCSSAVHWADVSVLCAACVRIYVNISPSFFHFLIIGSSLAVLALIHYFGIAFPATRHPIRWHPIQCGATFDFGSAACYIFFVWVSAVYSPVPHSLTHSLWTLSSLVSSSSWFCTSGAHAMQIVLCFGFTTTSNSMFSLRTCRLSSSSIWICKQRIFESLNKRDSVLRSKRGKPTRVSGCVYVCALCGHIRLEFDQR